MSNFLVLKTPKADGVDSAAVKKAALEQYVGYYVRHLNETDDGYEVHLAKLSDKASSRTRQAAPPAFLDKEKGAPADDAPEEGSPEEEAEESPEEEKEEDEGKDSDEGKDKKDKGEKGKKNPADEVKRVIDDLTNLFTELGGHIEELQTAHDEKDQKLKDISDVATPDGTADMGEVPPMADVPGLEDVGPTPGGGLGEGAPVPHKPPVPSGKAPLGPKGLPTSFTRTQIVDHPIKDDDGEYSVSDVEAAVKADERFAAYVVEEVKRDSKNGVFKAKLVLADEA